MATRRSRTGDDRPVTDDRDGSGPWPRPGSAGERLLVTADELFYAEGIRAVGIDRVLAESGVAKATLYQHFGSKDALVGAYLQRRIDTWHGYLDDALPASGEDPAGQIRAVFELIAAWMTQPGFRGCPFINAAAELPDAGHPGRRAVAEHRARNRARFSALAEAMAIDDADSLASSLVLVYDGALVAADLGPASTAASALLDTVDRLLAEAVHRGGPSDRR